MSGDIYPILLDSTRREDGTWFHNPCGTDLETAIVNHSIHDGPGPLGGGGEVFRESVPWCPTCDTRPSPNGPPLKENPSDTTDREILRRMSNRAR